MERVISNAEDCRQLFEKLKKELGGKLEIVRPNEVVEGCYHNLPYSSYSGYENYKQDQIYFYCKFCRDKFLRICVENDCFQTSTGHKLAALSDFYEALREEFGEPTLFYTVRDDENDGLHFEWAFSDREETIEKFMHGFPFSDDEVNLAIIIGESNQINEQTRELFSTRIGLPFELLPLINENIEDYMKYKYGQEKNYETEKSSDGYQKVKASNETGK